MRSLPWIGGLAALIVATDQEGGIDGLNAGIDLLLGATRRNEIDHGRLEASHHRLSWLTATLRSALWIDNQGLGA